MNSILWNSNSYGGTNFLSIQEFLIREYAMLFLKRRESSIQSTVVGRDASSNPVEAFISASSTRIVQCGDVLWETKDNTLLLSSE